MHSSGAVVPAAASVAVVVAPVADLTD